MSAFSHLIHAILTVLFFPWALVWLCCAVSAGNQRKKADRRMREEELQLLRKIAGRGDK